MHLLVHNTLYLPHSGTKVNAYKAIGNRGLWWLKPSPPLMQFLKIILVIYLEPVRGALPTLELPLSGVVYARPL